MRPWSKSPETREDALLETAQFRHMPVQSRGNAVGSGIETTNLSSAGRLYALLLLHDAHVAADVLKAVPNAIISNAPRVLEIIDGKNQKSDAFRDRTL